MVSTEVGVDAPVLSVVITVVDGGDVLRRFLDAIKGQVGAPTMELLLPYDASASEIGLFRVEYPDIRFIEMGTVPTVRPVSTAAGQHELYDRRRAAGLHVARGKLIAILEDRAPPRPDWAATMTRLHAELPHGVIGGAIECAAEDLLNWAFWASDFSRYGLPFESGPRSWVSDVNVCYKRRCMDMTRDIWRDRFNEAKVHWILAERGETLFLTNEAVVDYTTPYRSLQAVLPERFHWGRLFGCVRGQHVPPLRRLVFVLTGPAIPFVLFLRHRQVQRTLGNARRFRAASRFMLPMLFAWTTGEVWGYITRRP
jgi:hypothetical protein